MILIIIHRKLTFIKFCAGVCSNDDNPRIPKLRKKIRHSDIVRLISMRHQWILLSLGFGATSFNMLGFDNWFFLRMPV